MSRETEPAPTRRERRKLWRALRKLRQRTDLVDALNKKAQLQAQRRGSPSAEITRLQQAAAEGRGHVMKLRLEDIKP